MSDARRAPSRGPSRWLGSFVRGVSVAVGFLACSAWLPGSYESVALVGVEAAPPFTGTELTAVALALRDRLAAQDASVAIEPLGLALRVRVRDAAPDRALARCNELVRAVVGGMGSLQRSGDSVALTRAESDLASYVVRNQDRVSPASSARPRRTESDKTRLEIERQRIQSTLANAPRPSETATDNPFGRPPVGVDTRQLKLRLAEIDGLLSTPRSEPNTLPDELARLMNAVAEEPAAAAATPPRATITRAATLADRRIVPNRLLLLLVGALATLAAAIVPLLRVEGSEASEGELLPLPDGATERGAAAAFSPPAPVVAPSGKRSDPPAGFDDQPLAPLMAYPATPRAGFRPLPSEHAGLVSELRALAAEDGFVLVVSSTASAIARKLALVPELAAALSDDQATRVLLIDGDLAYPQLHRALQLDAPEQVSLAAQLAERARGGSERTWFVLECGPLLHVLPSLTRAPELLLSKHFAGCLRDLRPYYEVIVVHGAAVTDAIACKALDDVADGVLVACTPSELADSAVLARFAARRLLRLVPLV
jgi:hypothetical protein